MVVIEPSLASGIYLAMGPGIRPCICRAVGVWLPSPTSELLSCLKILGVNVLATKKVVQYVLFVQRRSQIFSAGVEMWSLMILLLRRNGCEALLCNTNSLY